MSSTTMTKKALSKQLEIFFAEDDLSRNYSYISSLPKDNVLCSIYIKSDLTLTGLPIFYECFKYLQENIKEISQVNELEGKNFSKSSEPIAQFELPFNVALIGERIALNLLHRMSSIATTTKKLVDKSTPLGIKILDTRKTTPGLRTFEKYAVVKGGGYNHRFGQSDVFMIKDNHKSFFGGLEKAYNYFQEMNGFYTPIIVEIHSLGELKKAIDLKVKHVMLDNFARTDILKSIEIKPENMTYEVSGGINLSNIDNYLIKGVDAISVGSITSYPEPVDISLKYKRV